MLINHIWVALIQFVPQCHCIHFHTSPYFGSLQGIWSKEAIRSFQKLCYDRTLVAAVQSYQDEFLLLFLCDTHTEEDLYIHSALQADGHAEACAADNTLVRNPSLMFIACHT